MLLDRIALQADGVPLFIEELTKDWMERAQDPDSTLQTLGVPTTLQGSLLARLDRLPDAKQVAQVGAVIGREFSLRADQRRSPTCRSRCSRLGSSSWCRPD